MGTGVLTVGEGRELCGLTVVLQSTTRLLGWHLPARVHPCAMQGMPGPLRGPTPQCREPLGMQSRHHALLCSVVPAPSPAAAGPLSPRPHLFASSYFAGTAHVTVMGMKCVHPPQLNGPFHPMATNHPHATSIRRAALPGCAVPRSTGPAIPPCPSVSVLLAVV